MEKMEKVSPKSAEAEKSTLGSMLLDKDAIGKAVEIINKNDFYWDRHSIIFETIADLFNKSEAVDLVTVKENLREKEKLEDVGGTSYLTSLVNSVPTSANVEHYAKIVEEKSMLRQLIKASNKINQLGYNQQEEAKNLIDKAESLIFEISQKQKTQDYEEITHTLRETIDDIQELQSNDSDVTGVPTGFKDLDRMTSGFQDSDLIIVAARPSMGKTALALNIAEHVAIEEEIPVAIFSLEMAKKQLTKRTISSRAQVDSHRIRTGKLNEKDWQSIMAAASEVENKPLIIDDTPGITSMELRAKSRRIKAEHGLGLIIVDYLQLMQSTSEGNRTQQVSQLSRNLKGIAREINVPVVALSQLSRAVEQREDKRPRLSDLRSSGSIEQDADLVAFLYRDEYYNPDTDKPGITEIIIGKQRNGPVGTVELVFQKEYTKFRNISQRGE